MSKLTKEEHHVLIGKGTEPPFSGKLLHEKRKGDYFCRACGSKLFSSKEKFDSGSGWPSFFDVEKGSVELRPDKRIGMERVEVICKKCKSHLGHLFDDGPKGKRYCINSVCMTFKPKGNSKK